MKAYANQEWIKLQQALEEIATTAKNRMHQAERSYYCAQETLQRIKEYIVGYDFSGEDEEVYFFKEIKPLFLNELIFHMKVFYVEADKPIGNADKVTAYYNQVMEHTAAYFERNHSFYIYYHMERTDLDRTYFTRTSEKLELLPEYSLDNDPKFSNAYSYRLAKMQAYERLNNYLQNCIYHLEHPGAFTADPQKNKPRNLWTDTKAALIELAYAIHSRGAVNHGQGDVKQFITDLEAFFNVQVGNFYRTFQGMRIRKKSRTPFLDTLKESLENRMDDSDLNYSN
ncbi:MAG: RteC domain-containing protein [Bacteroidetes bacterium]|nr:RteC domain-containing protein [Bacteroidota bacterium]